MNKIANNLKKKKIATGGRKKLAHDIKLCPFQSNGEIEIACTPKCALYRKGKSKGYECPISENTSISWLLRQLYEQKNEKK